jgi:hypothetical protein
MKMLIASPLLTKEWVFGKPTERRRNIDTKAEEEEKTPPQKHKNAINTLTQFPK